MNKEKLQQAYDEIVQLKDKAEKALNEAMEPEAMEPEVWEPEEGDLVFILSRTGKVYDIAYRNSLHREEFEQGNMFLTHQEAEIEFRKRAIRHRMRQYAKGFKPETNRRNVSAWYIQLNMYGNVVACPLYGRFDTNVAFATKADAQACIDAMADDIIWLYTN